MKVYNKHRCQSVHRNYNTFARCAIPDIAWVAGNGRIAVVAWCDAPTATLHNNSTAASRSKEFIDASGCGHACHGAHEIVELVL